MHYKVISKKLARGTRMRLSCLFSRSRDRAQPEKFLTSTGHKKSLTTQIAVDGKTFNLVHIAYNKTINRTTKQ